MTWRWRDKERFFMKPAEGSSGLWKGHAQGLRIGTKPTQGRASISDTDELIYLRLMKEHLRRPRAEDGKPFIKKATSRRSRTSNLLHWLTWFAGQLSASKTTATRSSSI